MGQVLGWVLWVAVLAINVGAIFALVALRRADRARLARWKRLCFASAASVFGLSCGGANAAPARTR